MPDALPFSPACERNKRAIWEAMSQILPEAGTVLEIGSGTGQHVVHFAAQRPALQWQPTDRSDYLAGLVLRLRMEGSRNILPPIFLDVVEEWPRKEFNAAYSANTAHIMSWSEVCAMLRGVALCLIQDGTFCLYGPFNEHGNFTAASNAAFDAQLKREDPNMGLRDIEAIESLAGEQHMKLTQRLKMPANNQLLVFRKQVCAAGDRE